jgi:hypothetical protein
MMAAMPSDAKELLEAICSAHNETSLDVREYGVHALSVAQQRFPGRDMSAALEYLYDWEYLAPAANSSMGSVNPTEKARHIYPENTTITLLEDDQVLLRALLAHEETLPPAKRRGGYNQAKVALEALGDEDRAMNALRRLSAHTLVYWYTSGGGAGQLTDAGIRATRYLLDMDDESRNRS